MIFFLLIAHIYWYLYSVYPLTLSVIKFHIQKVCFYKSHHRSYHPFVAHKLHIFIAHQMYTHNTHRQIIALSRPLVVGYFFERVAQLSTME